MSNESKKKNIEKRCVNLAIRDLHQLKDFHISDEDRERPDFILSNGKENIGIEHFLVDTLYQKQENTNTENRNSQSRIWHSQMQSICNSFNSGKDKGNLDKALKSTEKIINEMLNAPFQYSYADFEKEFLRIFGEHIKNVKAYRNNPIFRLGFICEIDIVGDDFIWDIYENEKWHTQAIKGIPLTETIWTIIQICLMMEFIDFFVFTVVPSTSTKAVSIFLTKNSRPKTCQAFTYRHRFIRPQCKLNIKENK